MIHNKKETGKLIDELIQAVRNEEAEYEYGSTARREAAAKKETAEARTALVDHLDSEKSDAGGLDLAEIDRTLGDIDSDRGKLVSAGISMMTEIIRLREEVNRLKAADYRKVIGEKALEILRKDVEPGLDSRDLEYVSYPEAFGSTAGPFGGMGGSSITSFQIDAFSFCGEAVLFANGRLWKRIQRFGFTPHEGGHKGATP